jgi:hypothetical protein
LQANAIPRANELEPRAVVVHLEMEIVPVGEQPD